MDRPPIFVGGSGRSGTTLVRVILDSHPNIACGPELKVIPMVCSQWRDFQTAYAPVMQEYFIEPGDIDSIFAEVIRRLLANYLAKSGKQRIAEKSPNNVYFFGPLHAMFPDSPLVHVIRDGRDVVCSLLTMEWFDPRTRQRVDYTTDAGKAAKYWATSVMAGRAAGQHETLSRRYYEVRYEDIVKEPEETLRGLLEFVEEPWDPAVLKFHEQKRNLAGESSAEQVSKQLYKSAVARWEKDLSPHQKRQVKDVAGQLLIDLGYASNFDW